MVPIGWKRTRQRLKQLFHYSDGHGDIGLLVATGQIQNPITYPLWLHSYGKRKVISFKLNKPHNSARPARNNGLLSAVEALALILVLKKDQQIAPAIDN